MRFENGLHRVDHGCDQIMNFTLKMSIRDYMAIRTFKVVACFLHFFSTQPLSRLSYIDIFCAYLSVIWVCNTFNALCPQLTDIKKPPDFYFPLFTFFRYAL